MRGTVSAAKRQAFVAAMAAGATVSDAARTSGYARTYCQRLLRDPEVQAAITAARSRISDQLDADPATAGTRAAALRTAIETLTEVARSADRDADRVAAARALLTVLAPPPKRKPAKPSASPAATPTGDDARPLTAAEVAARLRVS